MSNASQQIVNKAWNFAHVLRDDGLSYMTPAAKQSGRTRSVSLTCVNGTGRAVGAV